MEETKKLLIKNIIIGLACAVIVFLAVSLYLKSSASNTQYAFDMSFEMIDPQNPESTADEIIRLRRENTKTKNERLSIDKILNEIVYKDTLIENYKKTLPTKTFSVSNFQDNGYDKAVSTGTIMGLTEAAAGILRDLDPMELYDFFSERRVFFSNDFQNQNDLYTNTSNQTFNICNNSYRKYKSNFKIFLSQNNIFPIRSTTNYYSEIDRDDIIYGSRNANSDLNPKWESFIHSSSQEFVSLRKQLETRRNVIDTLLNRQKQEYDKKLDTYRSSRLDINDKAIKYGIVAFCVIALTMYIAGLIFRNKLRKNEDCKDNGHYHEEYKASIWYSVYLITVLLLIITIFILGLARLLGENSLAALLGGIAGYVLNNKMGEGASGKAASLLPTVTQNNITNDKPEAAKE